MSSAYHIVFWLSLYVDKQTITLLHYNIIHVVIVVIFPLKSTIANGLFRWGLANY